jgi:ribose transport system substrate-binding protein
MRIADRRLLALVTGGALMAGACNAGAAPTADPVSQPPASTPGSTTPDSTPASTTPASTEPSPSGGESGPPYTATLKDGSTFTLAPRIAEKVRAGTEINYVFSYQSPSIPLFSDQYKVGYDTTLPQAQEIYPMKGTAIAPVSESGVDVNGQIAQIEALLNTDQIDCISIEPPTSDGFTAIANRMMEEGIPVFTVGVTSNGNEFTNFTQIPDNEGAQAAEILLDWMDAEGEELTTFAVSGGDPTAFWAQGRMRSFRETIEAAIPDAVFVNTEENALATTYDPAGTHDAYAAFIAGNPEIDFIQNVDIGAEHAARAIREADKVGEIFTLGWNVSYGQLDAIEEGIQVVALDQKWSEQAGFGALACADLFASGTIRPNTQELLPVTAENAAEARAELDAILE